MIPYESFFLIILISILGPVIGLFALIFYHILEKRVHFLEMENKQIYLEKELEKSKYTQLNQQIQPHFLFNALNSLLGLIRLKKYDSLVESFEHMTLFLRGKYQDIHLLHPLLDEIDHTKHYLAIQQLRFGSRLKIIWNIDVQGIKSALAIPYLIQTLVENSFKHGIEMIEETAVLEISIKKSETERNLMLIVKDNGPGFSFDPLSEESNKLNSDGIGLNNIANRLALMFGNNAGITIPAVEHSGGIVQVIWPYIEDEK